jgi:hypothetical protein
MIEILTDFPDNVVALAGRDVVTRADYKNVLIPRIEEALKRHRKVSFYYELGKDFTGMQPGAMWEDTKIGFEHLTRWDRMAVVTDVEWIKHVINAFRLIMPGEMRVFPTAEASQARAWVVASEA